MSLVPRLEMDNTAVLLVDMQAKLMPVIHEQGACVRRAARLMEAAKILNLPRLVTEQYPRGLGHTVPEVGKYLDDGVTCFEEKTRFSACGGRVLDTLELLGVRGVILAGVEAHVCVLHTALDLLDRGFLPAVCEDAVSSRRVVDKHAAILRMAQAGVVPTTVESALLELCGDAGSDGFRAIRDVIKSTDH